jgi:hypothetical protein
MSYSIVNQKLNISCFKHTVSDFDHAIIALNKLEDPSNRLSVNAIGYAIENLRYLLGKSDDNHCQT